MSVIQHKGDSPRKKSATPIAIIVIAAVACVTILPIAVILAVGFVGFWCMSSFDSTFESTVDNLTNMEVRVVDPADVVSVGTYRLEPDEVADVSIATNQPTTIGCRVIQVFDENYRIDHSVHAVALEDDSGNRIMSASVGGGMELTPKHGTINVRVRNLLDVPIEAEVHRR